MSQQLTPIVEQLIRAQMATGRYASEEDLLVHALTSLAEDEVELRAIAEGLASVDRGERGMPVAEAFADLRKRHGIQD